METTHKTNYKAVFLCKLEGMEYFEIEGETVFDNFQTAIQVAKETVKSSPYNLIIKYIKAYNPEFYNL
jgi:hypothetical protein